MSANSINRSVARHALGTLLRNGLVATNKPVVAVYDEKVGDFKGQSPVVVITSDGISRKQFQMSQTTRRVNIYLAIWIFVLYADPATGWTEANAEDAIDLVEKSVADILIDHATTQTNWTLMTQEDRSQIDTVIIGGAEYQREVIVVKLDIPVG